MNFLSNSYIQRFGVAQLLYLVLCYVDLVKRDKQVALVSNNRIVEPATEQNGQDKEGGGRERPSLGP